MKTYPICLIGLDRRRAVVIGGGSVGARKVMGLLEAGAQVTVVSPALTPELAGLRDQGRIAVCERPYREGDLEGAFLAIAATGDADVNLAVAREAAGCGCLVNVVDGPVYSDFILPAVVRRGEIAMAVSTGGASPALARRLRERLEAEIGPEYGVLAEILAELRPLLARHETSDARLAAALRLVDDDVLSLLKTEGRAAARTHALALLTQMGPTEG